MNMFWKKFSSSPSDPNAIRRELVKVFRKARVDDVFTLADLSDQIEAPRVDLVAYVLGVLTRERLVDQYVEVVSPNGRGGIRRYETVDQLPTEIYDPFSLREISVRPELVRVYYQRHDPAERSTQSIGHHAG